MRDGLKTVPYLLALLLVATLSAQSRNDLPELTQPINDFANVIDPENAAAIDRMIRTLKEKTGDVVVVATVPTIEPYGDIREYANTLFENHGKGIGDKDKDNGVLVLLALKERRVRIEVGYGLEPWITDGFAGETSRQQMAPEFRDGRYGDGIRLGVERIIGRIAQGRTVSLEGVRAPQERSRDAGSIPFGFFILMLIILLAVSRVGHRSHRAGTWGTRRGWSGWSSGVGPFGGGWSGGGGGFGGGFGGFGGGRSGGGGGGSSW